MRLPFDIAVLMDADYVGAIIRALILVGVGLLALKGARLAIQRGLAKSLTLQQQLLWQRIASYTIVCLFVISALRELGFDFGVLLGAAGIVTVTVAFAAQTSASNLVSGLFLVLERTVETGDIIKIGDTFGEVLSIDLLSTKVRTFDNLLVRLPNETLVKTPIISYNRFPIRRIDMQIGVAYRENLRKVQHVLFEVARKNVLCLDEPAPLLIAKGFGDSSIDYQFSVWAKRENVISLRSALQIEVKEAFDQNDIEIPFPHRSLYMGSVGKPFPIEIVQASEASSSGEVEVAIEDTERESVSIH